MERLRAARLSVLLIAALGSAVCAGNGTKVPWPAPEEKLDAGHAEVKTVNKGYRREGAKVLVREIEKPTRANLDYAAYNANFMNADPPPEGETDDGKLEIPAEPFGGVLVADSLTGSITKTSLTEEERKAPLALAPLTEWLAS
ncbi:MAG TPA: hypothetical protein VGG33_17100, partial [Polyangia bacterium]